MWFQSVFSFRKRAVPKAISTYALDERRTGRYTFTSMKALVNYFGTWLSEEEIDGMVKHAKIGFAIRSGATEEETRLQFLKKCEYSMVRLLRTGAATA